MAEQHHHHWVLMDGYNNWYSCCDCGAHRGEQRRTSGRPEHARRLLTAGPRRFQRRHGGLGTRGAA